MRRSLPTPLGLFFFVLCLWVGAFRCGATSNVDPIDTEAWGANVGWLNWRPDPEYGVEVGQFILLGWVYGENIGWVNIGNGSPANGIQYRNDSPTDFGVNLDRSGNLRGYAYGANIGWIHFEELGAPKIDLSSGQLSGFAYGANIGWINLGDGTFSVRVESISGGADTDGDGIPDAWERQYAGDLTTLNRTGDADGDGQTDYEEYLADTDPLDPNDSLRILNVSSAPDQSTVTVAWSTKATRLYRVEVRNAVGDPWVDSGLGLLRGNGLKTEQTFPVGQSGQFFRIEALRPLAQ